MKNIIKFKDVITTDEKKEIADKLEEEYRKTKDLPPESEAADNDVELTPIPGNEWRADHGRCCRFRQKVFIQGQ